MKIAIIQGSSQKDKNPILEECLRQSIDESVNEIINFGVFPEEDCTYSYVQTAVCISKLLETKSVDFVITGCSSGQGMMLACNSLPAVTCAYVANPSDAFLFGRINQGNAVSFPLGLNFGWAGEINLKATLRALFEEPFGLGYPKADAERKKRDTRMVTQLNQMTRRSWTEMEDQVDPAFLASVYQRKKVFDYIEKNKTASLHPVNY